jgi:predicted nucleic acid-binding protein
MVIISDASPIIALSNLNRLDILRDLYESITITDLVAKEVKMDIPNWIAILDEYDANLFAQYCVDLDQGEASALALAKSQKNALLIIDERRGRKLAKQTGIEVIGLLGVVVKASLTGKIDDGMEVLSLLRRNGFRISDKLMQQAQQKIKRL